MLPPPKTVSTSEYFAQLVFPLKLIKDVAALYGCQEIKHHILDEIDTGKKADPVLMANVGLAHAYDPTMERVAMIIDMYETSRIFNSLNLAMPIDTPVKTKVNIGGKRTPHLQQKDEIAAPPEESFQIPKSSGPPIESRNPTKAPQTGEEGSHNALPAP